MSYGRMSYRCPRCGATGRHSAIRAHDCEEINQEPDWRSLSDNDIARRMSIQMEIVDEMSHADLEWKLAQSLSPIIPRAALVADQVRCVEIASGRAMWREGISPRAELVMLAAQVQLWLEDIAREEAA